MRLTTWISSMRRNNVGDMTIREQLSKAKEDICEKYCKYRTKLKGEDLNEVCRDCPVRKI